MTDTVKRHVAQQALVAVLAEAEKRGILGELEEEARGRVMGNGGKIWIANSDDKVDVMKLLEESLEIINEYPPETASQ